MAVDLVELRKQSRIAAASTALASLLVLGSMIWSYRQTLSARQQLHTIQDQTAHARADLVELEQKRQELQKKIQQSEATANTLKIALNGVVTGNSQATKKLDEIASQNSAVAQAVPRIFIHRSNNKEVAEQVARKLRLSGFIVPAPDIISSGPKRVEIVYFQGTNDPQVISDVEAIKEALRATRPELEQVWVQEDINHKQHPNRTYVLYLPEEG